MRGTACAWWLPVGDEQCCPPQHAGPMRRVGSVLLLPSVPLRTPHKRALVAGGTGRVGSAIAERLRADGWGGVGSALGGGLRAGGWEVLAAGRADGDLRSRDGAISLVGKAVADLGGL